MKTVSLVALPSQSFHPRVYGVGAWTDNLHFACDMVATLRPRLLVELGTDRGESYFAFCQAAAENGTGSRCFAVDTWQGDQQAGGYDETTFREVSGHNAAHYSAFSTLLRCSFDDALHHFASESIDLLHLDGLHTESAVRHDLDRWLPKLRPGGILLMHDISVRVRDFGVWKVWDELSAYGRSFAFTAGPGLGVWQKPPGDTLPEPLESLLGGPRESAATLASYYRERAAEMQQKIGQHWRDGTIRQTAAAHQTIIQVFHTADGIHREDDSVVARIGHDSWKEVTISLPAGAGAAPLRLDFLSAFTCIEIAELTVHAGDEAIFSAASADEFESIRVAGDAERLAAASGLRLRVTGVDPQLYLPPIAGRDEPEALSVKLRLRVTRDDSLQS